MRDLGTRATGLLQVSPTTGVPTELESVPALRVARAVLCTSHAWLVGGAIRDAALGREVTDIDIAVGEGTEEDSPLSRPQPLLHVPGQETLFLSYLKQCL